MSARDHILGNIRTRLDRGAEDPAHADARLAGHPSGPVPERARGDPAALRRRFIDMARAASAEVEELDDLAELPALMARLCTAAGLGAPAVAPDAVLEGLDWGGAGVTVEHRAARDGDRVCVGRALCGVAETGTLVLASGAASPITLAYLPDVHVVALDSAALVGGYEDAWARVRAAGPMPRAVNWITGPSRSADIEQNIQLGAHGPVRLVVALHPPTP